MTSSDSNTPSEPNTTEDLAELKALIPQLDDRSLHFLVLVVRALLAEREEGGDHAAQ